MEMVNLLIIAFAGLMQATLQLGVSALLLLFHATLGKNIRKKSRELTLNFILGAALFTALTLASACFVILVVFGGKMPISAVLVLAVVLIAMAFGIWFLYYRRGTGTELWVPRSFAKFIVARSEKTDDNVEAFSLGMLAACAEAPFALGLIIAAGNSVIAMPQGMQILAILVYVVMAVLPMVLMHFFIERGRTVVDIQRWRVKNKDFMRVMSGVGYFILAVFLIAFKVFTG